MDDAGDDPSFELLMERVEHDKVIESVATAALREGIDAGREETVQEGFDDGYSAGAAIGFAHGRLLGVLRALEMTGALAHVSTPTLQQLQDAAALITLQLPNMTDSLVPAIMSAAVASNTASDDSKAVIGSMNEFLGALASAESVTAAADHAIKLCAGADASLHAAADRLTALASQCSARTQLVHQ